MAKATGDVPPPGWDFFISYTHLDQAWAEWIAWVLEEDGYRVLIQAWDFVPGRNWVAAMQAGIRDAARIVAVVSEAYLASVYGRTEWQAAVASDPDGTGRKLLAVRVGQCERPGLLAGVVGADLFGVPEGTARQLLRDMVGAAVTGRVKPAAAPAFPGADRAQPGEPRFPGAAATVPEGIEQPARRPRPAGDPGADACAAAPYTGDLELSAVSSRKALAELLMIVYIRADRPSFRSLETATEDWPARLTAQSVSRMLRGLAFPRRAVMVAFLRACGVADGALEPWVRAWERIAVVEFSLVPVDSIAAVSGADGTALPPDDSGLTPKDPAELARLRDEVTRLGSEATRLGGMLSELQQWQIMSESRPDHDAGPGGRSAATELTGRYRLVSSLGTGAQGNIWLAEDLLLGRQVSLKQLGYFPAADRDERWSRALAEAKAVARVIHPAIPAIYDSFIAEDSAWIVFEYISGRPLADILRTEPLDEYAVAKIGLPVLMALSAAHAAGVVHRDVKPSNILVTETGYVYLVDFGIAKVLDDEVSLTESGAVLGTPEYIAPELLNGRPPSPASDLWSLGVTFYYALEGRSPFSAATMNGTLAAILQRDPTEPARKGQLADITLRLLDKDPVRRPAVPEVAAVLQSIMLARAAPAAPATTEIRKGDLPAGP